MNAEEFFKHLAEKYKDLPAEEKISIGRWVEGRKFIPTYVQGYLTVGTVEMPEFQADNCLTVQMIRDLAEGKKV